MTKDQIDKLREIEASTEEPIKSFLKVVFDRWESGEIRPLKRGWGLAINDNYVLVSPAKCSCLVGTFLIGKKAAWDMLTYSMVVSQELFGSWNELDKIYSLIRGFDNSEEIENDYYFNLGKSIAKVIWQ